MLALSFTIGYASFLGQLGRYYDGKYTKRMIRSFMSGIVMTAFLNILIAIVLFHFLALYVCEPPRVERICVFQGVDLRADADLHVQLHRGFQGRVPHLGLVCYGNDTFLYRGPRASAFGYGFLIDKRYQRKGGKENMTGRSRNSDRDGRTAEGENNSGRPGPRGRTEYQERKTIHGARAGIQLSCSRVRSTPAF